MKILQPDNNNKNNKFTAMKAASKAMKMAIKAAIMKLFSFVLMVLLKFWYIILILVTLAVLFDFIIEIVTAKSTPDKIIEELEVEEIADLVEIKSSDGGYYLDFKEGIDEKLDEIVEGMNSTAGVHNLPKNKEFLKKLIKAEAITQFPDLGGEIPEGTDGFQGSVKIRRVSPNKDVGEMKNTGKGETSAIEKDTVYDTIQNGNYDEILKTWQAGKKLTIKSDAKVYKQTESELDPGSDTGNWEEVYDEKTSGTLEIKEGTTVEYTGTYKNNTNPLSKEVVTYVEVKTEDITGYVKAGYLAEAINSTAKVEEKKKIEISSRAETRANKAIGDADKTYTIAIAAGHNNSDDKGVHANGLVEEDLTIEVAEEVEELLNQYSNVKVVQTGSTKSNPGGIKAEERAKITRNANPDLCIQIYFGSGSTGVQTIYRDGDGISSQLADVLAETISASMGLENKKAGTDIEKCDSKSLGIIDNAATSEYPSVVTEGGSLNSINDVEILKEDGVEKYAKGIVDGIEKYYTLDHSGYTSTEISEQTSTDSVESLVKNLKYVPYDTMKSYIEEGNSQALNVFSIDEENNLVTATWSKKEDGTTEIKENAPVNLKSTLEKYVMPYEYLLYFYIDTNETGFSEDLADKIINDTEIVIAVQDNVTTTETTTTLQERREDEKEGKSYDWKDGSKTTKITETCSTTVGITYVNTWCVKAYQENSYSSEVLDMGDNESKVINIKGKVNESKYQSLTDEKIVDEGTYSEQIQETNRETGEIETRTVTKEYKVYNRDKIDTRTISNTYEQGELKTEGKENTFVKAYQANNMQHWVRTEYLFKIMENNERTKNMLDLTKYLMYKSTNINYGKVEFDFSVYELESFKEMSIGGLSTLREYIRAWEGNTGISADGTKYIVGDDGAGHPTVGYGVDIYNSGKLDKFLAAGYDVSIGAEIDIEFVDALEEEELMEKLKAVEERTAGLNLTTYQKYALVSRAYNCGVAGAFKSRDGGKNFVDSYNTYWNQETDDQYGKTPGDSIYQHPLYTNFMDKPVTSAGKFMQGLENRRKSEWLLFTTGYCDRIDKWCSESDGGVIVENAVALHKYLRENNYKYSQAGIKVPNTSGKTIDCSSYVTWVLVESQVEGFEEGMYQWTSSKFANNPLGWETISAKDAQSGDIVVYSGHVEIIAENDQNSNTFRVYNCGSDNAIKSKGTSELPESGGSGYSKNEAVVILRVPI